MRTPLAATLLLALSASLASGVSAVAGEPARAAADPAASASAPASAVRQVPPRFPRLKVTTRAGQLDHPWDVQHVPGEGLLVSERDRARLSILNGQEIRIVDFPSDRVWVAGETGLMGLAVDPGFADNRRFYVCQGGFAAGDAHDVRVLAFRLSDDGATATQADVLLRGIQATSGRHGGCRLLITDGGSLLVGTGDAAVSSNPQNRSSLNGKVLRLDRFTGRPVAANPYADAADRKRRYVLTYGHRNIQGLAQRDDGTLWSVEHGTFRDDEVNRLRAGGNYGYDPGPGYDESVPMTDFSLPGRQLAARWRSGDPTVAPSGATFIRGAEWGAYRGRLAVAVLGDTKMMFQRFDAEGRLKGVRVPKVLKSKGRLRGVTQLRNGALLVTTDNGGGEDKILRVVPR